MARRSQNERVLLTGVAGFVGSHLADRLIEDGWEVIGVDNFLTGRAENIAHLAREPNFHFLEASVEELPDIEAAVDWVMHFASPASPPKYQASPIECMRCNSEGTRRLLELAHQKGAKFFLASTSEVYGDPEIHPQVESYVGSVNPVGPRSMYDESKRFAEAMTVAYRNKYGVDSRIIRIFNTYGPRMSPDDGRVISNFVCQALAGKPLTVYGDGTQTRSFQYIDDLLEGVVRLMQTDYNMPVNLGNPQEFTILDLAEVVRDLVHDGVTEITFCPLPKDDPTRRRPDISRAQELLGWQPEILLRDGLERTVPYFRDQLGQDERMPAGLEQISSIESTSEGPPLEAS
ncbi:SDR family oxidoreductase [Persicimonas caeni]|uniref:SDR family oxidoreductase n=1 Tax=Persicimonas caeni TaxID=2292766 RepID=A0A4Y6PX16_PERCE|nr:UDP-glucuronic acid decarboxylase family protein [Persicimonas caeni]QDG52862.1 SDR family oxidoreductase [Persicimonas caeni]QED34084.1 SDR family oxidoreductase [Persicimonas caeni]